MKNGGAKMIESWKVDSNKLMKKMNVTEKGLSDEQVLQIREKVGENLLLRLLYLHFLKTLKVQL